MTCPTMPNPNPENETADISSAPALAASSTRRAPRDGSEDFGAQAPGPSKPDNPGADRRSYVLAELRCAALRARLHGTELDACAVALRDGLIDVETALGWAADAEALSYLLPISPEAQR